jgi:acyl carrier protein
MFWCCAAEVAILADGGCVNFELASAVVVRRNGLTPLHSRADEDSAAFHTKNRRDPSLTIMNKLESIKRILRDTLQLGDRAKDLTESSALLGAIPELDSMAVISLITMIEDEFGITVADDEVTAETFETVGSLVRFVTEKT